MDKKIYITLTLICIIFLSGCESTEEKNYVSPYKDLVVTREENLEKYIDESRLEKGKNYTYDEAIESFSFILYKKDLNSDGITFTFNSNDNVKLRSLEDNIYQFRYSNDDNYDDVKVTLGSYTKDKYKDELTEDDYEIIKEENEYVFLKKNDDYKITFSLLKFFDTETCLEMTLSEYLSSADDTLAQQSYEIMMKVYETITVDGKTPYLQDMLVRIKNFAGKSIISNKYIRSVLVYEKSIGLAVDDYCLTIDYDNPYYYSDEKWKILDNEDLYILINSDKLYKIVVNGVPEYYLFERLSEEYTTVAMGEMLEDLYILLDIFYE